MEYRIINSPRGIRYMKGRKFCKVTDIPEDILQKLQTQQTIDTSKDCIFCGAAGTEAKLLDARTIYLCLADYNNRTTGEVAQLIRSRNG